MKIDGVKGRPAAKVGSSKKSSGSKRSSSASSGSIKSFGEKDDVEVSDHSATLDLIRDIVNETPEMRLEEVDRIMNQLKSKKYKINFEKVAEGFLKEAIMNEISRRPKGK